jgi:hypothetical protein
MKILKLILTLLFLTIISCSKHYESRGIAINGTDVYNVGSQNSNPTTPKLWINNTETPVQDAASGSRFVAIALQSK